MLRVQFFFEIALFAPPAFQFLLDAHLFGEISNHAERDFAFLGFDGAQQDIDRKF